MQINRVILNAYPLICMMKAEITEILPVVFRDIMVPEAVEREILVNAQLTAIISREAQRFSGICRISPTRWMTL